MESIFKPSFTEDGCQIKFGMTVGLFIIKHIAQKYISLIYHQAKYIFFSTDLTLSSQEIIKFYSSRFQIEFNFRDAKEFFGLEDFMNVTESTVKTAVNISFFMVLLSQILLQKFRDKQKNPLLSIRDLISSQRAEIYLAQTLKLFRKLHPNILITETFESIRSIGRINL